MESMISKSQKQFTVEELFALSKPNHLRNRSMQTAIKLRNSTESSLNICPVNIKDSRKSETTLSFYHCHSKKMPKVMPLNSTSKLFLQKGVLNSHLDNKATKSKTIRFFHETKMLENKNARMTDSTANKFKYLSRRAQCQPLCGLFKIKCCNCKESLDSFNFDFIELLRKQNRWHLTNSSSIQEKQLQVNILHKITDEYQAFLTKFKEQNPILKKKPNSGKNKTAFDKKAVLQCIRKLRKQLKETDVRLERKLKILCQSEIKKKKNINIKQITHWLEGMRKNFKEEMEQKVVNEIQQSHNIDISTFLARNMKKPVRVSSNSKASYKKNTQIQEKEGEERWKQTNQDSENKDNGQSYQLLPEAAKDILEDVIKKTLIEVQENQNLSQIQQKQQSIVDEQNEINSSVQEVKLKSVQHELQAQNKKNFKKNGGKAKFTHLSGIQGLKKHQKSNRRRVGVVNNCQQRIVGQRDDEQNFEQQNNTNEFQREGFQRRIRKRIQLTDYRAELNKRRNQLVQNQCIKNIGGIELFNKLKDMSMSEFLLENTNVYKNDWLKFYDLNQPTELKEDNEDEILINLIHKNRDSVGSSHHGKKQKNKIILRSRKEESKSYDLENIYSKQHQDNMENQYRRVKKNKREKKQMNNFKDDYLIQKDM